MTDPKPPSLNKFGNRLEGKGNAGVAEVSDNESLIAMKNSQISQKIDNIFSQTIKEEDRKPAWQPTANFKTEGIPDLPDEVAEEFELGVDMSDKDKELSLDDLGELELGVEAPPMPLEAEGGLELTLDSNELDLSESGQPDNGQELDTGLSLSLDDSPDTSDLSLSLDEGNDAPVLDLGGDGDLDDDIHLDFEAAEEEPDLSNDALEKLKEIDEIMVHDASEVDIKLDSLESGPEPESSLVSEDLDLQNLNFGNEELDSPLEEIVEEALPVRSESRDHHFEDIGDMERTQATISNLRADRENLLAKIQSFEEEKVLQNRQNLNLRAELDEKKIELSIIRKKLNDEISELKDRMKLNEEKKLILEEKNRLLAAEVDRASQKNKIDIKKVQMRERDLEQKLELLKADAEIQIRNRDLKILELKRKLDAMEFDIESISTQEKRSVESRYELEDKLDKAIKTLRSAISALENESDKSGAIEALKKNVDM